MSENIKKSKQIKKGNKMKGQKELAFLIHGMNSTKKVFNNYIKYFKTTEYKATAFTLPYHDRESNNEVGNISILVYVEYIRKKVREAGRPVTLIGHSMGGLIAQMVAALEPDLVKAVVAITPAPPRWIIATFPRPVISFSHAIFKTSFWNKPHKSSFEKAKSSMLHLVEKKEQKRIHNSFLAESGRALFEIGFWPFDLKGTTGFSAKKVKCPILFIAAKHDRVILPITVLQNYWKFKLARHEHVFYKKYKNNAHWIIVEPNWKEVVTDIHNWLRNPTKGPQ